MKWELFGETSQGSLSYERSKMCRCANTCDNRLVRSGNTVELCISKKLNGKWSFRAEEEEKVDTGIDKTHFYTETAQVPRQLTRQSAATCLVFLQFKLND